MKLSGTYLRALFSDVSGILSSRERRTELLKNPLYSNAIYLVATGASNTLLNFVFWIIVARFYSQADVGLAGAVLSGMSLVGGLAHLGLGTGLIRYLPHAEEDARGMVNTALTAGALFSAVGAVIFVAGTGWWSPGLVFLRHSYWYAAAFVVFTVAATALAIVDQAFVAYRKAGFVLVRTFFSGLFRLALPVLLAASLHSFGIFTSWGAASLFTLALCLILLLPRIQRGYRFSFTIKKNVTKGILSFSILNHIADFLWNSPGVILTLIVINLMGAETNAYFYIAWGIGNTLAMASNAVATSLFAEGSHEEAKLGTNLWKSLKMVFLILVPVVVLVLLLADKLLLLFGSTYSVYGTALLRLLAISSLPTAINISYFAVKRVRGQLIGLLTLSMLSAGIILGLSYLLLPRIGIIGVGFANLGAQTVITFIAITESPRLRKLFAFHRSSDR
jgi:O-antigen/teichoic acid export membrane protein